MSRAQLASTRRRSGLDGSVVTDEDVMDAVASGDEQAFERLYVEHSSQVYGVILRVLRDPAQAEEVAQEVFLEAWSRATRFSPARGSVRSWLVVMAHGRAVDRVRSVQSATDRDRQDARRSAAGARVDHVGEDVARRLEDDAVRSCVGRLSHVQRQSIELAYFDGLTYREVAERLDVPLGTVKTRIRDGLLRLRDSLGELDAA